jgi:hypothetical protein
MASRNSHLVNQDDSATVNLERIIAGLCRTSISGGTSANGLQHGIAHYLSACGISPSQYVYTSTGNPDLSWLAERLAPNVAADPTPRRTSRMDAAISD